MDTLTIEPTYRVALGDVKRFRIMLVGVGGTGSTLALFLAGLAFHAQQKGIQVEIMLVDDDTIEAQNVGRQHFAASSALMGNVPQMCGFGSAAQCSLRSSPDSLACQI